MSTDKHFELPQKITNDKEGIAVLKHVVELTCTLMRNGDFEGTHRVLEELLPSFVETAKAQSGVVKLAVGALFDQLREVAGETGDLQSAEMVDGYFDKIPVF